MIWTMQDYPREWCGELGEIKLRVVKRVRAGVTYEGFINGGLVVRARTSANARNRLEAEASKRNH